MLSEHWRLYWPSTKLLKSHARPLASWKVLKTWMSKGLQQSAVDTNSSCPTYKRPFSLGMIKLSSVQLWLELIWNHFGTLFPGCTFRQTDTHSVSCSLASFELTLWPRLVLNFCLHLPSAEITSQSHHSWFMGCWGWNPGLCDTR